jgi:hypothetical protein
MTISKYESQEVFGNEMFAEMDRVLKTEFDGVADPLQKNASVHNKPTPFSDLVAGLAKAATILEDLEHPLAVKANKLLGDIEVDFLK